MTTQPKTIYLKDYKAPAYRIEHIDLRVDIHDDHTLVSSSLTLQRNLHTPPDAPLVLHGAELELLELAIEGTPLPESAYELRGEELVIRTGLPTNSFVLSTVVRIYPERNTALEGLYLSKGMYCTQCEPEGFRKITWYVDRPDVMALFTTTITADRARYPVLLANGNLIASGDAGDGRHYATWQDPFRKPSYLFALVAGNLGCLEDHFITRSGRRVTLRIFAEESDLRQCHHAMDSLKASMRWDEQRYGREYDLDIFMVVAVSHFNMGAMENKGLNIFNTSAVLAHPETTTDLGFRRVESVVAHEYFHNWTGNRVTCRDWFQLSLKEGFTVFRDQQFSAEQLSASVQRIDDVAVLRNVQFAEDAGPLSHPVRPESFIEINNFYTATVYEKGAEIVRMLHTVLGAEAFRRGTDLYFSRHDGQAVTVEDFVAALADANGRDLSAFMPWYRQPGTPVLQVQGSHDAATATYTLQVRQQVPVRAGFPPGQVLPVPVKLALLAANGDSLPLQLAGESGDSALHERVLLADAAEQSWTFTGIDAAPVPSLLRDFSAPVILEYDAPDSELLFLMQYDSNGFNRWLSAQTLYQRLLLQWLDGQVPDLQPLLLALTTLLPTLVQTDRELAARLLALPTENYLAEQMAVIDPAQISAVRQQLQVAIANQLQAFFAEQYAVLGRDRDYVFNSAAIATRSWRATCLHYLLQAADNTLGQQFAAEQYAQAAHMTDRLSALRGLVHSGAPQAAACLTDFHARFASEALVIDAWFTVQATSPLSTPAVIAQLCAHPEFTLTNPNRMRSVLTQFASANPLQFHSADGAGYRLIADKVAELDALNPQVASRLLGAFGRTNRLDAGRKAQARAALQQLQSKALSGDVYETLTRLLA